MDASSDGDGSDSGDIQASRVQEVSKCALADRDSSDVDDELGLQLASFLLPPLFSFNLFDSI